MAMRVAPFSTSSDDQENMGVKLRSGKVVEGTRKGYGLHQALSANNTNALRKTFSDMRLNDGPLKVSNAGSVKPFAASQKPVFLDKLVEEAEPHIPDPDTVDKADACMVSGHVKEIMTYLHEQEPFYSISEGFLNSRSILPSYRKQLLNWIFEVHAKVKCVQETLFLAVYLIDRFTQLDLTLQKEEYQLVGVTGLWLAAKFEEIYPPHHVSLARMTDNAFQPEELVAMEKKMLNTLKFHINRPLACTFLRRASKVGNADVAHHTLAKFFCELSLLDYDLVSIPPSKIAAASLCLAFHISQDTREWTPMMETYTFYKKSDLRSTMTMLARTYKTFRSSKYQAVFTKYSNPKLLSITLSPCLSSPAFNEILTADL